jgi:hypothetical protein
VALLPDERGQGGLRRETQYWRTQLGSAGAEQGDITPELDEVRSLEVVDIQPTAGTAAEEEMSPTDWQQA